MTRTRIFLLLLATAAATAAREDDARPPPMLRKREMMAAARDDIPTMTGLPHSLGHPIKMAHRRPDTGNAAGTTYSASSRKLKEEEKKRIDEEEEELSERLLFRLLAEETGSYPEGSTTPDDPFTVGSTDPPLPTECITPFTCPEGETCNEWTDGCNNCGCNEGGAAFCTLKFCPCLEDNSCVPVCLDNDACVPTNPPAVVDPIPDDVCVTPFVCPEGEACSSWSDGCNECGCDDAVGAVFCTDMWCDCYEDDSCVPTCLDNTACTVPTEEYKQPPWPQDVSDIPLDPAIKVGELKNGMRYMLRSNSEPPNKMELRLHVDAGANMELDDELGMAHFLEHMMFRTTASFPPGELVPTFSLLGVGFGSHVNAYTNFIETVYMLGLPDTDNATLTPSFTWLKDVMAPGALLLNDEIQVEKGVIVSELEARDSVGQRLFREQLNWTIPDHLLAERNVIGTEETVMGVTRQMMADFYYQYYVPRRVTLVAVGDMNTTDMEAWVHEYFDGIPDTGNRGREPDMGTVSTGQGLRSNVFVDNEVTNEEITIETVIPTEYLPDTREQRRKNMGLAIANAILRRRLQRLANEEGGSIIWGGASRSRWYHEVEFGYVYVEPKRGQWREAVFVLEQELRRALEYGFTQTELDEQKANRLNAYEQGVASKDTRQTDSLADGMADSVNGGFVIATPEENLAIATEHLESITLNGLYETFRSYWNTTDINVFMTTNSINGTKEETAAELLELYAESQMIAVEPPEEVEPVVFAYTDFGPPGTVVSDTRVEDLDIRQLVLSNGIRVNIKKTEFEADIIRMVARFGIGQLGQPEERTFLDSFTDYMITWGGLGEHNWEELNRATAGKTVGFSMSVQEGAFTFSGGSNGDDQEFAMQLMVARFVDPGFGDEALRWWRDETPALLDSIRYTLDGAYDYDMYGWLLGGDERFTAPTEEEMYAFEASDARDWLVPYLNTSYMELSIVGDLDEDTTIDLILKTFGALPAREETPPEIADDDRFIATPPAPQTKTFTYESKLPQAASMVVWDIPAVTGEDIATARKFNILSSVYRERLRQKIREELGGTYSPSSWSTASSAFDYGFFFTYVEGITDEVELFSDITLAIAENITTGLISEDEFLQALLPFQTGVEDTLRDNGYWLYTVLEESQAKPYHLDWSRGRLDFYDSLTVDDINDLAKEYLIPDNAWTIYIVPVNATTSVQKR